MRRMGQIDWMRNYEKNGADYWMWIYEKNTREGLVMVEVCYINRVLCRAILQLREYTQGVWLAGGFCKLRQDLLHLIEKYRASVDIVDAKFILSSLSYICSAGVSYLSRSIITYSAVLKCLLELSVHVFLIEIRYNVNNALLLFTQHLSMYIST